MADEWVEIVKPKAAGTKIAVPRDAVIFGVNGAPRGAVYVKMYIGAGVAAKLRWIAGMTLRIRWSNGGGPARLKIDPAPPAHVGGRELKASKGAAGYFTLSTSALPEGFVRERLPQRVVGHEAITDRTKPDLSELIVRLPVECMTIGKKHAA